MRPTGIYADHHMMSRHCETIIQAAGWGDFNQIGLTHRPQNPNSWFDAAGSLWSWQAHKYMASESDYQTWHQQVPQTLIDNVNYLCSVERISVGRVRIMRLPPKTGLTVHKDTETRYHYVLKTNEHSFFCYNTPHQQPGSIRAECYHMPCDAQWYHCDTTRLHWVYNGGSSDRIHLVISALDECSK